MSVHHVSSLPTNPTCALLLLTLSQMPQDYEQDYKNLLKLKYRQHRA